MQRFITNYTIVPPGCVLTNHITEVDSHGRLTSIKPVDEELAYTAYVPNPLLVAPSHALQQVLQMVESASYVQPLCELLATIPAINPHEQVVVLELFFDRHTYRRLV